VTTEFEPQGEHDQRLLGSVRPAAWKNPEPAPAYNLVVVGAGPAGLVAAAGAAGLGAKVALIEKRMLGGDCLNFGCVPSKALVRAGRAAADVKAASAFGVNVFPGASIDFPAVMERVRSVRADIGPNDSAERFQKLGIDVFFGEPEFVGRQAVAVDGKTLRFTRAIIATGARPARLPIPGLWEAGAHTNETIFQLTTKPRRLLVIGAGPIGVELAQAFARLGVEVTLLEALHGLLPREDPDASSIVRRALENDGIRFRCCVSVAGVDRDGSLKRVRFASKHADPETADFEEILVGVGRAQEFPQEPGPEGTRGSDRAEAVLGALQGGRAAGRGSGIYKGSIRGWNRDRNETRNQSRIAIARIRASRRNRLGCRGAWKFSCCAGGSAGGFRQKGKSRACLRSCRPRRQIRGAGCARRI